MRKKNKSLLLWGAGAVGAVLVVKHFAKKKAHEAAGWGIVDMATPYGRGYSQPWGYGSPWNPDLEPWARGNPYSSIW